MVIFNCLSKGFVKIDGEFSVSTITKNVEYPCEIGDLIITTPTNRYIFQDVTLSIDDSLFITDEILDCLISNKDDKCVIINLDCPNENTGTKFLCKGDLITEHV